jgi:PAS domain S-box-containing protein
MDDAAKKLRAEAALRESASRAQAILNTTVDGIISIDSSGIIESFNQAAERLFGYQANEVIGKNVNMLMPAPYQTHHDGYLRNYMTTGQARIIGIGREVVGMRKDRTTFPMHLAVSEVQLDAGHIRVFTGIVRDLTRQKALERELLEISDREQRRIGQDLHDGLGQQLAGIGFLSKSLENRLAARDLPEAGDARQIADLVARTIGQARAMARGLHPVDSKGSGLMAALEELSLVVKDMFRISCRFSCPQPIIIADNATAVHVYRIAQESVNNAVRHGRAKHVVIHLEHAVRQGSLQADDTVTMTVEDDGIGIPAMLPQSKGMGMQIMKYRSELIGATLTIKPGDVKGTVVCCSFSYPSD